MARLSDFYHRKDGDSIWWTADLEGVGDFLFSFDKKTIFNMFRDYPYKLTNDQVELFDKENPFWAEFFEDRKKQ